MITISKNKINNILSEQFAYDCVLRGIKSQSNRSTYVNPRSAKSFGNNKLIADMAASIEDMQVFGFKHYTVNNGRYYYYIYLYDFLSKELLTVMEAEKIGKYRTAAVTSLAIDKLRTSKMKNLSIIGTGFQAKQQLNSILACNAKFNKIFIYSLSDHNREIFVTEFKNKYKELEFVNCPDEKSALIDSDVIVTATNSEFPVIHNQYLKDNYLIIGMGAATPYFIEIDQNIIGNCDLILVDDKDQAKLESGDLLSPISKGISNWNNVLNFSEIFEKNFDLNNKNKIFFKSLGIALWDIAIAKGIYDLAT